MKHGSPTPPRRRPRAEITIKVQLRWALPTLRAWAAAGPTARCGRSPANRFWTRCPAPATRSTAGQGLKSIFRLLKARKVLFVDPTSRIKTGQHEARQALPVNLELVARRAAQQQPGPRRSVALIAFHGLRAGQLQRLLLTDVRDGRLSSGGRTAC